MSEFGSEPKSGIAKVVTAFATIFLVSLGLCGVNFVAAMSSRFGQGGSGEGLLMTGAYLEVFGMAVGAAGLAVVGVFAGVMWVVRQVRGRDGE